MSATPSINEVRQRLASHFSKESPELQGRLWDELWADGSFLPWDKGRPNPALIDTLSERREELGVPTPGQGSYQSGEARSVKRKKALVPGCGKGYDVLLLSAAGYDAYGLEVSQNAVKACEALAREAATDETIAEYTAKDQEVGKGAVNFLVGDFFRDDWWPHHPGSDSAEFDLIYDYTFLCALPPSRRPAWALRMSQLLSPTGRLVCLEFPTSKNPSLGGPPFGLTPSTYVEHLSRPGESVPYDAGGNVIAHDHPELSKRALARVAHWQPARSFEIGQGTDWVSIWRHSGQ